MHNFKETIGKASRFKSPFLVNDDLVHIPTKVQLKEKKLAPKKKTSPRENLEDKGEPQGSDDEEKAIEIEIFKDPNQEVYVLPTFFKPGRHSYVVSYLSQEKKTESYFHRMIAPSRHEDIPPCIFMH